MNRPVPVWLVAVTATALALAVWVLAVPVAGVDLEAGAPPQTDRRRVGGRRDPRRHPGAPGASAPCSADARRSPGG